MVSLAAFTSQKIAKCIYLLWQVWSQTFLEHIFSEFLFLVYSAGIPGLTFSHLSKNCKMYAFVLPVYVVQSCSNEFSNIFSGGFYCWGLQRLLGIPGLTFSHLKKLQSVCIYSGSFDSLGSLLSFHIPVHWVQLNFVNFHD